MREVFDPEVCKATVFSTPFRRKLFEPVEPPFGRSFAPRLLMATHTPASRGPPLPITGTDGEERLRVSDVKAQLEEELDAMEAEVHREFLAQLTEYPSQRRREQAGAPPDDDTELPAFYS
jgi:hypothetical protein